MLFILINKKFKLIVFYLLHYLVNKIFDTCLSHLYLNKSPYIK
uniref:Uncharacterized protein n=1 Tax=viral metagenome TaxID=1070528 RepID=A0A6C0AQE2_9ZZZZ